VLITVLVGPLVSKSWGMNPELFIRSRCSVADNSVKMRRDGADQVVNPYVAGDHKMKDLLMEPSVEYSVEYSVELILPEQNVDLAIQ